MQQVGVQRALKSSIKLEEVKESSTPSGKSPGRAVSDGKLFVLPVEEVVRTDEGVRGASDDGSGARARGR